MLIQQVCSRYFVARRCRLSLLALALTSVSMVSLAQQKEAVKLEEIVVQSQRPVLGDAPPARTGGQVATGARMGILGNVDVMDTPFSVTSYTDKTIEDRHAQSMADLLAADPSVRQSGPRTHMAEGVRIRGYSVGSASHALSGMFGLAPGARTYLEPFERVEVVKGPSAALFGMAPGDSIGGVINMVPKRAKVEPINKATVIAAQDSTLGLHLDVGRRFAQDMFGIRFNLMQREGDTAMDYQSSRRKLASVAMDFNHDRLSASLDVIYGVDYLDNVTRPFNLPVTITQLPRAPDGKNAYSGGGDYESSDSTILARLEYKLGEHLDLYMGYGEHRFRTDGILIYPTLINTAGDYSYLIRQWKQASENRSTQTGLRGWAKTGSISHQFSFDWSQMKRDNGSVVPNWGGATLNIYWPKEQRRIAKPNRMTTPVVMQTRNELSSFALADTLGFVNDSVLLSLGIRNQKVLTRWYSTSVQYNKRKTTPFVGVVYKVKPSSSLYASYVEGLQAGAIAPNTPFYSNPTEQLPPYVAKQKEVGVKFDFDDWMATVAVYELTRPIAGDRFITAVPPVDRTFAVIGEERSRGFEIASAGQIFRGIRLLGGVNFNNARIADSPNPTLKGKRLAGVARFQVNLGTEWDVGFVPGLTLNLNGMYTDRVPSRNDNGLYAPSWKTFDTGLRYKFHQNEKKNSLLRFNIHNLTNERYWGGTGSYLGAPRTWSLSFSMDM